MTERTQNDNFEQQACASRPAAILAESNAASKRMARVRKLFITASVFSTKQMARATRIATPMAAPSFSFARAATSRSRTRHGDDCPSATARWTCSPALSAREATPETLSLEHSLAQSLLPSLYSKGITAAASHH